MLTLAIFFTVLSAAFNATSTVLQRQATGIQEKTKLYSRSFLYKVTKHPLFLMGTFFQIIAATLHLLALSNGPLIVVQPILTLDLVFLVLFLHFRYKLKTGKKEWITLTAIVLGLCSLFVISDPQKGNTHYVAINWYLTILIAVLFISGFIAIAKVSSSPKVRALFSAMATAVCYALNSGFAKLTVTELKSHGLVVLFSHWPVYALIVSAILSVLLMQNAYASGPLATSQPILETGSPLISSFLGIILFGDVIRHSPLSIIGEIVSA
ncbi:MAG TPA: DMT family transporter, partial [Candidatus Saccharimonadales bacterium]|nr:DMT family transporter [Candidatus Saccharimonadales bacterium]